LQTVGVALAAGGADGVADAKGAAVGDGDSDGNWQKPAPNDATNTIAAIVTCFLIVSMG